MTIKSLQPSRRHGGAYVGRLLETLTGSVLKACEWRPRQPAAWRGYRECHLSEARSVFSPCTMCFLENIYIRTYRTEHVCTVRHAHVPNQEPDNTHCLAPCRLVNFSMPRHV